MDPIKAIEDAPAMTAADMPLPDAMLNLRFGYDAHQMRTHREEYAAARVAEVEARAAAWESLYRRAVNQANGLTNYVEDRPELRHAERRLTEIENDAKALKESTK